MKFSTVIHAGIIAVSIAGTLGFGEENENNAQATEAAKAWLKFIDTKEYEKSWSEAAPFFREKISKEAWIKLIPSARNPLGEVKSREVTSTTFTKILPGAPDGEYVVIQFKTSFEHKADAVETITPMKVDGVWRVSGYFIK